MSDQSRPRYRHPRPNRTREHAEALGAYRLAGNRLQHCVANSGLPEDSIFQAALDFADAHRECEELGMFEKTSSRLSVLADEIERVSVNASFSRDKSTISSSVTFSDRAETVGLDTHGGADEIGRLASLAIQRLISRLRS